MGYDPEELDSLPESVTESFCGVGNPLGLGEVRAGDTLLDLGSGAGMHSILAARRVGGSGKVIGVDMTYDMIRKARQNAGIVGETKTEFRLGDLERLPV